MEASSATGQGHEGVELLLSRLKPGDPLGQLLDGHVLPRAQEGDDRALGSVFAKGRATSVQPCLAVIDALVERLPECVADQVAGDAVDDGGELDPLPSLFRRTALRHRPL